MDAHACTFAAPPLDPPLSVIEIDEALTGEEPAAHIGNLALDPGLVVVIRNS
ncbi:MAG: hypothetical protein M0Z63_10995 [Actinomycetota bacterium]|nr:hypothetical protein [Actinomycetota bacterium]